MLYRVAVGIGLFLLGYALGRRERHPVSKPRHNGTSRIRDALSGHKATTPENSKRRTAESKSEPATD